MYCMRIRPPIIIAGVALLLISTIISWWPEPVPRYPTSGSSVVVFGDSLAAGVGAKTGNDIAGRLAMNVSVPVYNLGVAGDTTADALARLDAVVAKDPRVVVILLGGNDAIQQRPVADTFADLEEIIVHIQDRGAAVVLVGEPGGLYGSQYETAYEELARAHRTFYVSNILAGLIGRSEYMYDYIHPNDAGYARALERIQPVVIDALTGTQ